MSLVGLAALLVRWPNYQLIPAFTDEVYDLDAGFMTAQGKIRPLADIVSSYNGSLWDWLLALVLRISDYSLYAPRTLILICGVLTVPAAYLIGRAWGGRLTGLLAALLLATCTVHVVVNSHVAWSNCLTPLFTTLAAWALYRAVQGRRPQARGGTRAGTLAGRMLALSGLFWGLALQTHPSVLGLLPGAAVFLAWRGRRLLRTRWLGLAAALFVLANLNLVIYNLTTRKGSLAVAAETSGRYSHYEPMTLQLFLSHLGELVLGLLQTLAGTLTTRGADVETLRDPAIWPIALLAAAGLVWQWRRGNRLPGLLLASELLILPLFNRRFHSLPDGRYYMPLLPLLFGGVAALVVATSARLGSWRAGAAARAAMALGFAWLVLHPLAPLQGLYATTSEADRSNAPIFALVDELRQARRADTLVVLDSKLSETRTPLGGGELAGVLHTALTLARVPHAAADLSTSQLTDVATACRDQIVVLAPRPPEEVTTLVDQLSLLDLDGGPPRLVQRAPFFQGAYRVGLRPAACRR